MLYLAAALLVIGLVVLWQARHQRDALGLPAGRVIYTDTNRWGPVEQALYDPELGLTGRPDYLVEQGGALIPVEVKSQRVSAAPYDTHIFQLAAYCMLVERCMGKRPPYGILHYPDRSFAIDYTPALESALLELMEEMRRASRRREVMRSHQAPERCHKCGYARLCDQKLL